MEDLDRAHRDMARGTAENTPVRALTAVTLVVAVTAAILIAVAIALWLLLR